MRWIASLFRRPKRYLLFAGDCYYSSGGANDLQGAFDSVIECFSAVKLRQLRLYAGRSNLTDEACFSGTWYHVYDTWTGKIVCEDNFEH